MFLAFSVLLNVILVAVGVSIARRGGWSYLRQRFFPSRSELAPVTDVLKYERRKGMLEALPPSGQEIIFLGDSITEGVEWHELFQCARIRNRGIGGDRTDGIVKRLPKILHSMPESIYLMVGINDLGSSLPSAIVLENYRKIISSIRAESPTTEIFVQSVLPINENFHHMYRGVVTNGCIRAFNHHLEALTRDMHVHYINLFSEFLHEGQLHPAFTDDGIHLTREAYLHWKNILSPFMVISP